MGCGASKGSDSSAEVPQQKKQESTITQAAASAKAADQDSTLAAAGGTKGNETLFKQSSAKAGSGDSPADPPLDCVPTKAADADEGEKRASLQEPSTVVAMPEQDAAEPSTPNRPAGDGDDNPARAGFRAAFPGLTSTEYSPSPGGDERGPSITFKSSRSLNRSIGVRRRTSDSGGNGEPAADGVTPVTRVDREEEAVMTSPDSVLERFEKTKGVNPLLRKATEKSIAASGPKATKTQKRLAVGFAVDGGAAADSSGGAADEVTVLASDCKDEEPGEAAERTSQQRLVGTAAAAARADGGG